MSDHEFGSWTDLESFARSESAFKRRMAVMEAMIRLEQGLRRSGLYDRAVRDLGVTKDPGVGKVIETCFDNDWFSRFGKPPSRERIFSAIRLRNGVAHRRHMPDEAEALRAVTAFQEVESLVCGSVESEPVTSVGSTGANDRGNGKPAHAEISSVQSPYALTAAALGAATLGTIKESQPTTSPVVISPAVTPPFASPPKEANATGLGAPYQSAAVHSSIPAVKPGLTWEKGIGLFLLLVGGVYGIKFLGKYDRNPSSLPLESPRNPPLEPPRNPSNLPLEPTDLRLLCALRQGKTLCVRACFLFCGLDENSVDEARRAGRCLPRESFYRRRDPANLAEYCANSALNQPPCEAVCFRYRGLLDTPEAIELAGRTGFCYEPVR